MRLIFPKLIPFLLHPMESPKHLLFHHRLITLLLLPPFLLVLSALAFSSTLSITSLFPTPCHPLSHFMFLCSLPNHTRIFAPVTTPFTQSPATSMLDPRNSADGAQTGVVNQSSYNIKTHGFTEKKTSFPSFLPGLDNPGQREKTEPDGSLMEAMQAGNTTVPEGKLEDGIPIPSKNWNGHMFMTQQNVPDENKNAMSLEGNGFGAAQPTFQEPISNQSFPLIHLDLLHQCHIFKGKWVYDDSYPLYQPTSCPFVDEGFSCKENGRPDSDYMRWRWKPDACDIPKLNATDMLERLKGKRLVFVGDSLNRNQFESLLCILREGIVDKNRLIEIHGRRITKSQGSYSFKFLDYNCYIEFYRSHFLVDEGRTSNGTRKVRLSLKLDKIDKAQSKWRNADILVFNTGHWWTHTKVAKGRNFFQERDHVFPALPVATAYKKALSTWAAWIDKYVDPVHARVFFRGYSPAHFRGGQWNSGGQCNEETEPIFNDSYVSDYREKMVILEEVIRQMRTSVTLMNVTKLSDYRKDAHPSIYGHNSRSEGKRIQDCSHWCLPGLPDIWNELLYALLLKPS